LLKNKKPQRGSLAESVLEMIRKLFLKGTFYALINMLINARIICEKTNKNLSQNGNKNKFKIARKQLLEARNIYFAIFYGIRKAKKIPL